MTADELASMEYEALQSEKRDKMAARLQVWSLFMALVSAFGLASIQPGAASYLAALYPVLAVCVARYSAHSESILDQIKAYLLAFEQQSGYKGYEQFNKSVARRSSGGHKKAFRDALLLTEALATVVVVVRLVVDQWVFLAVVVAAIEIVAMVITFRTLREDKR
jgi:hypothetical protein